MTAGLQLCICTYEESIYDGAELKGIQASETSGQYCYSVFSELTHEAQTIFLQYVNVCGVQYTVCSLYGYYAGWLYYNVWKSSCYDVMYMFTGYIFLFRLYCGQRKKVSLSLFSRHISKCWQQQRTFFVVGTASRPTTNGTNIIRL